MIPLLIETACVTAHATSRPGQTQAQATGTCWATQPCAALTAQTKKLMFDS